MLIFGIGMDIFFKAFMGYNEFIITKQQQQQQESEQPLVYPPPDDAPLGGDHQPHGPPAPLLMLGAAI